MILPQRTHEKRKGGECSDRDRDSRIRLKERVASRIVGRTKSFILLERLKQEQKTERKDGTIPPLARQSGWERISGCPRCARLD